MAAVGHDNGAGTKSLEESIEVTDQVVRRLIVQTCGDFVGEQEARTVRESDREAEPPHLAVAKLRRESTVVPIKTHSLEQHSRVVSATAR
jgi:hypothetical protein